MRDLPQNDFPSLWFWKLLIYGVGHGIPEAVSWKVDWVAKLIGLLDYWITMTTELIGLLDYWITELR